MRNFFNIFVLLVLNLSLTAQAQEITEMGYSESHRQNKKYSLTAQPAGLGPVGIYSNAITFGYFLNPKSIVEVEYLEGKNFVFLGDLFDRLRYKVQSFGVYYKLFFSNTFYGRFGANSRIVDYHSDSDNWLSGNSTETYDFRGHAFNATFSLGNQWQWENFTLGCEWVGLELPISKDISSQKYSGNYATQSALDEKTDRFLKQSSINLVHLYLGLSF